MKPVQFTDPYSAYHIQQTENFDLETFDPCKLLGRICEDWKFSALIAGSVLSIISCATAIFTGAYFFSICFAGLAAVCIFAAKEIHDLGSLKKVSDELKATNENLTNEVDKFKTLNGELQQNVTQFQTENNTYEKNNTELQLQVQSFQSASAAIQDRFNGLIGKMDKGSDEVRQALTASIQVMKDEYTKSDALCKGLLQLFANKYQELNLISRDWKITFNDETIRCITKFETEADLLQKHVEKLRTEVDRLEKVGTKFEQIIDRHEAHPEHKSSFPLKSSSSIISQSWHK